MSLSEQLLSRTHKFLRQNHYPSDPTFCRTVAETAERLIRSAALSPKRLAAAITLPASYRHSQITKLGLAQQLVDGLHSVAAGFGAELNSEVFDFMKQLKYYIRRHVALDIYNKGKPREKPGKNAIRDALFGFFQQRG